MNLSQYLDDVETCESREVLDALLIKTTQALGASAISGYAFPYGGDTSTETLPIISTWPEAVQKAYRARMAGTDPIMYAAMTLGTPVHFLDIEEKLEFNAEGAAVIDIMRSSGFRDGVTTPVLAQPGVYAYFAAAFTEPRPDLTMSDLRAIKIIFTEYFCKLREIERVKPHSLSKRELQVLLAIIHDKSNVEIAEILGVSEHTVGTYVRRCFEKLDVNSRTQAILRYLGARSIGLSAA